ncbi:HAD family hydrolase [Fusobacterium sp. MFO224]|uniref:HAD family hydrolase n=1 Tax=Fusobacterium sp. MFO224 TaxID=3378070 RepID=UPI003853D935
MLKNIIFDLGNVLIEFNPYKFVDENVDDKYKEEFLKVVFLGKQWKEMDRGTLEYSDAMKYFKEKLPNCEKTIDKLFGEYFIECLKPIEENIDILKELKKNYKLYIISNFHYPAFDNIYGKWEFLKLFQGKIISGHVKMLKPEEKIYNMLFEKYNLDPRECLFIDDSLENVEASKKLGMQAIHLEKPEMLYNELLKKNVI